MSSSASSRRAVSSRGMHHSGVPTSRAALVKAGRRDLLGSALRCLVPPAHGKGSLDVHATRVRAPKGQKAALR